MLTIYKKVFELYIMKFNKEDFRKFVLSEVKKIAAKEGWIKEETINNVDKLKFENIVPKEQFIKDSKEETKKVKKLAEELKRMKQLLDFRNPLLGENS